MGRSWPTPVLHESSGRRGWIVKPNVQRIDTLRTVHGDLGVGLGLRLGMAAEVAPESPGQIMWVFSPRVGIDSGVAVGVADRRSKAPLTSRHTVRVASIGKSFTALAALRLVELGLIGLDEPLRPRVLGETCWRLLTRHGYSVDAITLHHLLGHVSGLPDYAEQPDGKYVQTILSDPMREWKPEEQVAFALDHYPSTGPPGQQFAYSDTGYLLVGQIIERVTGQPLPKAVRRLADHSRAGLTDTYLELLEPASSSAPRATQYVGDQDLTHGVSATIDLYGGGGQVSSMRDIAHFYRYLGSGEAFASPKTLSTMTAPVLAGETHAGLGIFSFDLDGRTFVGHSGAWGLLAGYCRDLDLAIAHTWNQMLINDAEPFHQARSWVVRQLA
jgi:D-alanyl-D-alanine carboxypeptidase